jgi:hypothetical protein
MLPQSLEVADWLISETVDSIARQARLIEELQSAGEDSAQAEEALEAMATSLEHLLEDQALEKTGAFPF